MRPETQRRRRGVPWLGILVAVVAVAGIGYWLVGELWPPGAGPFAGPTATTAGTARETASVSGVANDNFATGTRTPEPAPPRDAQRAAGRSDTILTCAAVDGQVFYTNATRCEDADLDNRINVMATPSLPASRPDRCLGAQAGGPPQQTFLPVCQEAFNAALRLEPFLLELEDPVTSPAARDYCGHITAGVQSGCMATSEQFCFLHVCQALREAGGP